MVATNLCVWTITVVQEGAESYAHYSDKTLKLKMSFMTKQQTTTGFTSPDRSHFYTLDGQGNIFSNKCISQLITVISMEK